MSHHPEQSRPPQLLHLDDFADALRVEQRLHLARHPERMPQIWSGSRRSSDSILGMIYMVDDSPQVPSRPE